MNFKEEFPDLHFFMIQFAPARGNPNEPLINQYFFASLESSLSLKSVCACLKDISPHYLATVDAELFGYEIYSRGIWFAETGKFYHSKNFKELKKDYLICKLSKIVQ